MSGSAVSESPANSGDGSLEESNSELSAGSGASSSETSSTPIPAVKSSYEENMDHLVSIASGMINVLADRNEEMKSSNDVDVLATMHKLMNMKRMPSDEEYIYSLMNALSLAHQALQNLVEVSNPNPTS
jgi:hypothetical protein